MMTKNSAPRVSDPPKNGSERAFKMPIRHILVPTDLASDGRKAIDYAMAIARRFNANLILAHIYDPAYSYVEMQEVIKKLELLCNELRGEHAAVEFRVGVGVPYLQIPAIAKEMHTDLMVIARHNYNWLEQVIFGPSAEEILRRTTCPVLVVNE
jgi:nucleotide-binding universal stress UspA family protein